MSTWRSNQTDKNSDRYMEIKQLRYSKEIFGILSKGGFLSDSSYDQFKQAYFNELTDYKELYTDLLGAVGFNLETGENYYYASREMTNQVIVNKVDALCAWLMKLDLLKTYDSCIGPGYRFNQVDFQQSCQDLELSRKINKVFPNESCINDMADKLMMEMVDMGFAEQEIGTSEKIYRITAAFNYIERLLDCVEFCKEEIEEDNA